MSLRSHEAGKGQTHNSNGPQADQLRWLSRAGFHLMSINLLFGYAAHRWAS